MPAVRLLLLASLALWVGPCRPDTASTAAGASEASEAIHAYSPAAALNPAAHLHLRWASTDHHPDYGDAVPGTLVQVTVIVENAAGDNTQSTSFNWDPDFAAAYAFVGSDPSAWRARVDENGWGVLDTSGVLAGDYGTFRLWFEPAAAETAETPASDPAPEAPEAPRLIVVSDGTLLVADVVATAQHDTERARASTQYQFERDPLATAGELLPPETSHPRSVLGLAVGLSVFFMALLAGGTGAALNLTNQTSSLPS